MRREQPLARTSDTHRREAKYAAQKASLSESPLAQLCLPALERVIDWSQHLDRQKHALIAPGIVDTRGLEKAAAEVLGAYQAKLRELDTGEPLPVGIAMSLWTLGSIARAAHHDGHGSRQKVKLIELEASAGEPRSICIGKSFAFDLPEWAAEVVGQSIVESHAFGCFRVFCDTSHARGGGTYWSMWCPNCKPSAGQRRRHWRTRIKRRWIDHAVELHARR
jgi:hypothetical protein